MDVPKPDPEAALEGVRLILERLNKHEAILATIAEQMKVLTEVLANHEAILTRVTGFKPPPPKSEAN